MFNFFKSGFKSRQPQVEKLMDQIKEAGKVIPPKVESTKETDPSTPVYQIGRAVDGTVTLRIGDGYTHSTLTMNAAAVKRLIRMLEVAVEFEYNDRPRKV